MNAKKFNIIVLAGGERGPLYDTTGFEEKALIPIHGKPMVSWVIDSFRASDRVDQIVVVGSSNLDTLESMQYVRKRVFEGMSLIQNLLLAVTYVKHRLYQGISNHGGYVISFCDAVFLTPEIINNTLAQIEAADADIVLHYVERETYELAGIPAKRTYIPVGGKHYTGTTIYYIRRFSKVLSALPMLGRLRQLRKDPQAMLETLGCPEGTLADVEQALGQLLKVKLRILTSTAPELGMDVDKPADLDLATEWLKPATDAAG